MLPSHTLQNVPFCVRVVFFCEIGLWMNTGFAPKILVACAQTPDWSLVDTDF